MLFKRKPKKKKGYPKLVIAALLLAVLFAAPGRAWADYSWPTSVNILTKVDNSSSAQTDTVIWTPASGKRIVLLGFEVTSVAAQTTKFEVSDVVKIPLQYSGASIPVVVSGGARPVWVGTADQALTYTTTANTATSVMLWGYEENSP